MIQAISRVIPAGLLHGARRFRQPNAGVLRAMQDAMKSCIQDCEGRQALKLRHTIDHTQTVQELWLLRNDAFQLVANAHNHAEAAQRINALMEHFRGWVNPKQMVKIG